MNTYHRSLKLQERRGNYGLAPPAGLPFCPPLSSNALTVSDWLEAGLTQLCLPDAQSLPPPRSLLVQPVSRCSLSLSNQNVCLSCSLPHCSP